MTERKDYGAVPCSQIKAWYDASTIKTQINRGKYSRITLIRVQDEVVCLKKGRTPDLFLAFVKEAGILHQLNGAGGAPLMRYMCTNYPALIMTYCGRERLWEFNCIASLSLCLEALLGLAKSL